MEVSSSGYQRYKVLWPPVPAMAMVMIDFTIVSATTIQHDVHLSETGEQWLHRSFTTKFAPSENRLNVVTSK